MLALEPRAEPFDHLPGNSAMPKRRLRPDVDEIRIANSVGQDAGRADDAPLRAGDANGEAILKRTFELLR